MLSKLSRIPDFYKLSVSQRVRAVRDRGLIDERDYLTLVRGDHTLKVKTADKMIENVIGVMGLPVGLGLNFLINDKDYVVPLVVEEPSIVAVLRREYGTDPDWSGPGGGHKRNGQGQD